MHVISSSSLSIIIEDTLGEPLPRRLAEEYRIRISEALGF